MEKIQQKWIKNHTNPEFRQIQSDRIIVYDWQSSSRSERLFSTGATLEGIGRRIHSFS